MMRKKGQIAILAGLGLLAAVLAATGLTVGSIQELLQFVVNHWTTLFVSVLGVAVAATFVVNSWQENPHWKKDIIGLAILLGLMIAFPYIAGREANVYKADVKITVRNPYVGDMEIKDISKPTNFRPGSQAIVEPAAIFSEKGVVSYETFCDNSRVGGASDKFDTEEIGVGNSKTTKRVLKNLPLGGNCVINVKLRSEEGRILDTNSRKFTVEVKG